MLTTAPISFTCTSVRFDGVEDRRTIVARSAEEAARQLIREGWTPIAVLASKPSLIETLNRPVEWGGPLTAAESILMTERLAMLLEAGLTIDRSLDLLVEDSAQRGTRALVARLIERVRHGDPFSSALRAEPKAFPAFYVGMVEAAEGSGTLAPALRELAETLGRVNRFRQAMVAALTYPAIVLFVAIGALMIVIAGVVPQFEPLFAGEEQRLHALTRIVLFVSRIDGTSWLFAFAGLLLVAAVLRRSDITLVRGIRARLPGRRLVNDYAAARFCRVAGSLGSKGVPLIDAIALAKGATGPQDWHRWVDAVVERLREGEPPTKALAHGGLLPVVARRLAEAGEHSGQLAAMLSRSADILEGDVSRRLERLVAVIGPATIVALGALVTMIILGVMLGLLRINELVVG